jgi:tetratricopeptide (TPR) repeat protein
MLSASSRHSLLAGGGKLGIADFVRGSSREVRMSKKHQTLWLAAAIGIAGATGSASGQEIAMAMRAATSVNVDTTEVVVPSMEYAAPHAASMVADAVTLERPGHYLEAAELYEAAASLLEMSDPAALEYRSRAGLLCYHAGDLDRALVLFEEIGRQATDLGNTEVAAQAYERAMHIAFEQGDKPKAATLYLRSLSQEERDKLLERRNRKQRRQ